MGSPGLLLQDDSPYMNTTTPRLRAAFASRWLVAVLATTPQRETIPHVKELCISSDELREWYIPAGRSLCGLQQLLVGPNETTTELDEGSCTRL